MILGVVIVDLALLDVTYLPTIVLFSCFMSSLSVLMDLSEEFLSPSALGISAG